MGGQYPSSGSHFEHNFGFHNIGPSTQYTVNHLPGNVERVFSGFELGVVVETGGVMTDESNASNPCRQAYIDHSVGAGAKEHGGYIRLLAYPN